MRNLPSASATATGAARVTTAMERMAATAAVNFMMIIWKIGVSNLVVKLAEEKSKSPGDKGA